VSFHHLALATRDLDATHHFYTEAMKFELVHVEDAPTDAPGGWLRHAMYDVGGGELLTFMELHDDRWGDLDVAVSRGLGLPAWVNHVAFEAADEGALDSARNRWLAFGLDVAQMEHTHGTSVYAEDPNGNVVEWACTTRPFDQRERFESASRLHGAKLAVQAPSDIVFLLAADYAPV
jgi:catechol 2,3-dioxygenase-like lactoylglutathione lyase family enzyme